MVAVRANPTKNVHRSKVKVNKTNKQGCGSHHTYCST